MTPRQQYIVMDFPSAYKVDSYPIGSVCHRVYLYLNPRVASPYTFLYIVDHDTWDDLRIVAAPPPSLPLGDDLHGYEDRTGALRVHPVDFPQARASVCGIRYIKTKIPTVANPTKTTKDYWVPFRPYHIDRRGERNVPKRYLEAAFWKDDAEIPGYITDYFDRAGNRHIIPVEFNFENTCWTEIRWDDLHNKYKVLRPAGGGLRLDILASNVVTRDQWGLIDGQYEEPARSPTPKTPAPSPSLASNPEDIYIHQDEAEELALENIAKSIPVMTSTTTQAPTQIRTALFTPQDQPRQPEGNPPGGDPADGNPGGGGDGGGDGDDAQGLPHPGFADIPHLTDRFIGKEPPIFTGDRDKAQAFLSQWNRFAQVNIANRSLQSPYIKAMMFLTYIQGPLVDEWTSETQKWIETRPDRSDPWVWSAVELAFKRQFRDNMEQERARLELDKGFKMTGGDIDSYVTAFEKLVRQADYRLDDPLVLDKFTRGVPLDLYRNAYQFHSPVTYHQWKTALIEQQKRYLHMKARVDGFGRQLTQRPKQQQQQPPRFQPPQRQNQGWQQYRNHPDTMDTTPGRNGGTTHKEGHLSPLAEDSSQEEEEDEASLTQGTNHARHAKDLLREELVNGSLVVVFFPISSQREFGLSQARCSGTPTHFTSRPLASSRRLGRLRLSFRSDLVSLVPLVPLSRSSPPSSVRIRTGCRRRERFGLGLLSLSVTPARNPLRLRTHTDSAPYNVEFNFDNLCWVEITWNPIDNRFDAVRPAGRNFNCDIDSRGLPTREQWGQIDGQPEEEPSTSEPRTPAPSETSGDETSNNEDEPEIEEVIQTAESLHLNEPETIHVHAPAEMATATTTHEELATEEARRITEEAEAYLRPINPTTGHRMTADDAAIFRAVGPDHPDPPPGAGEPAPQRRPGGGFGQGPPNPPRGGGPPHFGGGGGNPFGGGPPPPPGGPPPAGPPAGPPHGAERLAGETPSIFDGNRKEYESFLTQWHIYWGQNAEAPIMTNIYRRCLLFLGFIKGPQVANWTLGFLQWLNNELRHGRSRYDEYLWDMLTAGFTDRFSNVLEQEEAQATLAKGFKMIGDDIDSYVTNFEQLARKADYRLNDRQTLDRFTAGLPKALFTKIYELDDPQNFNEWKDAAIRRQKQYIHLRARLNFTSTPSRGPPPARQNQQRGYAPPWTPPRYPPPRYDPNAMDTSADRTRARLAMVGDPNRAPYTPPFPPRGGPGQNRGGGQRRDMREVICYNCNNPGHFSRDCTRPRKQRQQYQPRASTSRGAETDYYSQEPVTARRAEATAEEQAKGWMDTIRGASDEVKDLIFKDLWTQEGFQDA
ncbi:hypothetical protein EDB83DRAFT_2525871 [Lactarius deliciosus]|nr:hypothetical protein EDB83DRAFT_2525871 [Lactarius deliciosus]